MPSSTPSSAPPDPHLWITVLAGGVGSRFWPASTPARPKQLLPLAGNQPIVLDTLERALALAPMERVRVLAGGQLADRILAAANLEENVLLREPSARGTAPVLTWAAWAISRLDPDAVLVSLHSDHLIEPLEEFVAVIRRAAAVAADLDRLVTVGVVPDRPETGYGYLLPGAPLPGGDDPAACEVSAFVEKPGRETAIEYLARGYLWNSGIFVWKASAFLEEVRRTAPEIASSIHLLEQGDVAGFFESCPSMAVDVAVLERSRRVATVRASFHWDDVGSWEALSRTRKGDEAGNVCVGNGQVVEGGGNIVYADGGTVVVFGAHDLVVVRTGDITLVMPRERAPDLKSLLAELPDRLTNPPG